MNKVIITNNSAIIAVDIQNDFCPGGALPVPDGDAVVYSMNLYITKFSKMGLPVYFTRDWHPQDHISFKTNGGIWPEHCIQETYGAELHKKLLIPSRAVIISKGISPDDEGYSGFQGTDLDKRLKAKNIRQLFIGGLATDYCVRSTVLDALHAGFDVVFLSDASKGVDVNTGDSEQAIDEMLREGAVKVVYGDIRWQH
ncbi:MAG: isochorismatase family protein [Nitrospirota bacterium]